MADNKQFYPVGTPGVAWGEKEKTEWFKRVDVAKRSYKEEVLIKIDSLKTSFDVMKYGTLSLNPDKYPLYVIKTRNWDPKAKPTILVT
eukprot:UC4_evm1s1547